MLSEAGKPIPPFPRAATLDALGHAVMATDMEGHILYWNDAATRLYGFNASETIGRQIYYVLPAALGDDEIETMMRGFSEGKPWDGLLRIRRKDGAWIRTIHSDRVLTDEHGKPVAIVSASFPASAAESAVAGEKEDFVAKHLVRSLLQSMRRGGHESAARMREMGRAVAKQANCPGATVYLELFSRMGLGDLKLEEGESRRFVFAGTGLLERVAESKLPTCHLPLGFLEGAVSALSGRPALGSEVQCQSMGASRCVFIVSAR